MKYSVIIPVYNAEKTLDRCLNSLLREGYPDAEILLVNDGSTDGSGELCADYASVYPNVRYICKENGGVSTARNAGLDIAGGEYVVFVDSDDQVLPGFFYNMDKEQSKADADYVMFSCCFDNKIPNSNKRMKEVFYTERSTAMPAIVDSICKKTINGPVAKIYKRSILDKNHLRFPEGVSVAEDRVFNICYTFYINSLQISNNVLYCVNTENENSLSRKRHNDLQEQFKITEGYFSEALNVAPISDNEKEQYRRAVDFGSCRYIFHEAKLLHTERVGWLERQKKLGRLCDTINRNHFRYPNTRYCKMISLPVRLRLTWVIDAIAWKLTR